MTSVDHNRSMRHYRKVIGVPSGETPIQALQDELKFEDERARRPKRKRTIAKRLALPPGQAPLALPALPPEQHGSDDGGDGDSGDQERRLDGQMAIADTEPLEGAADQPPAPAQHVASPASPPPPPEPPVALQHPRIPGRHEKSHHWGGLPDHLPPGDRFTFRWLQ